MTAAILVLAAVAFLLGIVSFLPRLAIRRAQDRLAERVLAGRPSPPALLTRADLVVGRWRRQPGVLALEDGAVVFEGVFGGTAVIPAERIGKVVTGSRMASDRLLVRQEVLRISRIGGSEVEFVLSPASAGAWRSHLGLWAMAERMKDAETVTPGRS